MPARVIDAHQHFWDLTSGTYPWMAGDAMHPLRRNFGPDDLRPLLHEVQVNSTILVQCRSDKDETRDFLAIAAREPFVAGVVGWVDLQADDVANQIAALRDLPGGEHLVGIRHNVHDESDAAWLSRPQVRNGLASVFEAGLTFDLLVKTRELSEASALVSAFPQGRFVLDHMAKPPIATGMDAAWQSRFEVLAKYPNVWCKISGLITEADWSSWTAQDIHPYLNTALKTFGPDRVIFGSDWPVCTLAGSYAEVKAVADQFVSEREDIAERLFFRNAVQAYTLSDRQLG